MPLKVVWLLFETDSIVYVNLAGLRWRRMTDASKYRAALFRKHSILAESL